MTKSQTLPAECQDSAILTAESRVFAIPELIEAILRNLSIRDLLLSQLVCPFWASTISSSPALQQKLFFKPTSSDSRTQQVSTELRINTLLASVFPVFFSHPEDVNGLWNCQPAIWTLSLAPWFHDEVRRAKFLREDASWRRMYPVQPARLIGKVKMRGGCGCGTFDTEFWGVKEKFMGRARGAKDGNEIDGSAKTTMGFLYDLIVWIADEWPEVDFWIDVGLPYSDPLSDGSMDGFEENEERGEAANDSIVENQQKWEEWQGEEAETGPLKVFIVHSQSCYSSRGNKLKPSGLMVRGFDEDAIEMLEEC